MVAIYLLLGILYESPFHPVTILSTVPSAGLGALLALKWAGQELTFVALVGIILLIGIVKKKRDHAGRPRAEGAEAAWRRPAGRDPHRRA